MVACTGAFKSICRSNMMLVCNVVFRWVSTTDRMANLSINRSGFVAKMCYIHFHCFSRRSRLAKIYRNQYDRFMRQFFSQSSRRALDSLLKCILTAPLAKTARQHLNVHCPIRPTPSRSSRLKAYHTGRFKYENKPLIQHVYEHKRPLTFYL